MQHDREEREKPLKSSIARLFICVFLVVISFCLGYASYYLTKIQQFIATNTNQSIAVTPIVSTLPNQTNILLLGSDNDQKFTGNPLTQTMLVVHIDYSKKEVDMFSIPRDLWVKMPDKDTYGKIDQASEYHGIPSAINVVQQTFGIPIDHYAWVGLYGFIKSIDSIGGVNLSVVHPVLDNAYPTDINSPNPYGLKRLNIQPGRQHMTGASALEYVRSRHEDQLGDFGRTQRQRQLLLALKQTVLSSKSFLTDAPGIFDSLKDQIKTDITITTGTQLGLYFLTNKNIVEKQYTLSPQQYTRDGTSTDGQSIIVANATASASLITDIFGKSAGEKTLESLSNIKNIQP